MSGGGEQFEPGQPVCVLSPHLDDAVLSCGDYLAANPGTHVVTVFSGAPARRRRRGWNARTTGKTNAAEALRVRRMEDQASLGALGAVPHWLGLWEDEYRILTRRRPLVRALTLELRQLRAASVVVPLGLHHRDHLLVSDAAISLAGAFGASFYLYAESPYAQTAPLQVDQRLRQLRNRMLVIDAPATTPPTPRKRQAAELYGSQYPWLQALHPSWDPDGEAPERYFKVEAIG